MSTKLVRIAPYDRGWPARYASEAPNVARALGDLALGVEHIGSTAVPGLLAKPTVDILVGTADVEDVGAEAESAMALLGYEARGELGVPGRRYFRKGESYPRDFNVHVVTFGGRLWRENLAFRDHLRRHRADAKTYGDLKRDLVSRPGGVDIDTYGAAKAAFIERVLAGVAADHG